MSMTGMDFAMGGGRVKYRELATAAANQTFAQQLTQLKTTWDTLTDEEKMRCIIYRGAGLVFSPSYTGAGLYSCIVAYSTNAAINCMNIRDGEYWVWGNSQGLVDYSSTNHASTLSLLLLDVVSE